MTFSHHREKDKIPARTPISMKTSVPHELIGPNARLWVSSPMRASSCSSEHDSLSCPRKSTALLQPPGSNTASGDKKEKTGRKSGHQIVSFAHLCLSELLTWTQRHWRDSSLRLWLHTQRSPVPPGCLSPAGSDSAWLSSAQWWTTQPAGMERGVMTQT